MSDRRHYLNMTVPNVMLLPSIMMRSDFLYKNHCKPKKKKKNAVLNFTRKKMTNNRKFYFFEGENR